MTHQEKISRLEFLKGMGFKGAALMALVSSCVSKEDTYVTAETISTATTTPTTPTTGTTPGTAPVTSTNPSSVTNPLVKLDLNSTTAAKLKTIGGYIISNSIVIARIDANTYVAATQTCTHEPKKKVIYSNGEYYCTDHGARFSLAGKGLNSLGSKGLTIYKVAADAITLVVY